MKHFFPMFKLAQTRMYSKSSTIFLPYSSSCKGGHGLQFHPDLSEVHILLFADDIVLTSDTVQALQRKIINIILFQIWPYILGNPR